MQHMMHYCCGPDGKPDFDKMAEFMKKEDRSSVFDVIGWALFFIWVGFAWLVGLSVGWGVVGVGVLTLGMQGVRYLADVRVEGFWLFVGAAFLIGGFWEVWSVGVPLMPIVLILAGIGLLIWRFGRSRRRLQ